MDSVRRYCIGGASAKSLFEGILMSAGGSKLRWCELLMKTSRLYTDKASQGLTRLAP